MAFASAQKGFGKKRGIWLAGLLACLLAVSGFSVWRRPCQTLTVSQPQAVQKIKGVWLNYMEFSTLVSGCTEEQYRENADRVIVNLKNAGLNTLFVHLRSHSDSLYPSDLFPWSVHINGGEGVSYDPLAILIEKAHAKNIEVHGWVNPYRVSSGTLAQLPATHPAAILKQQYPEAVKEIQEGVYYNPAHPKVRELVLNGVEEILSRYEVDGIQFDDYFYPTVDEAFDKESYEVYRNTASFPLSLAEYRRTQVNLLIASAWRAVHQKEGAVFGVSPAAGIADNRETLYADVGAWVQDGYVDYLCPQLYFGFDYPLEPYRFETLLKEWKEVAKAVPLYIGIASYKLGQEDRGSTEWVTATDILARQTEVSQNTAGVCFYHYSSLFDGTEQAQQALVQLKKALEGFL